MNEDKQTISLSWMQQQKSNTRMKEANSKEKIVIQMEEVLIEFAFYLDLFDHLKTNIDKDLHHHLAPFISFLLKITQYKINHVFKLHFPNLTLLRSRISIIDPI
ncbi:hypothetical protein BLOT_000006 [Blomia tropicalis]|nr:hypothetical protein BLOT_000006 [Blomia tropicalis]